MKKSLVLAMAMALGVTASAYAANPFSDVPAGHWAYDSVAKLAAAGVVDGYGDTTFGGDKLMTRYEMAQIVAKAMAKGANVDKLAAEFADELDTLGVRVANLEKKADNVKITGQARYRYIRKDKEDNDHNLRSRIWVNGAINDDWSYTGMLQNVQVLNDNKGNEDTDFQRAYLTGKLGGLQVTAGRYNAFFANGNVFDTRADGIEASYGSKVKLTAFMGKATDAAVVLNEGQTNEETVGASFGKYAGAELSTSIGALNIMGGYVRFKDIDHLTPSGDAVEKDDLENKVWYVGADMDVAKHVNASAMFLKGKDTHEGEGSEKGEGWAFGLTYKGAKAAEVGSYGLFANYYNQEAQTVMAHTTDAATFDGAFKGYGVGIDYTVAKNIVTSVAFYDTKNKEDEDKKARLLYADVVFNF